MVTKKGMTASLFFPAFFFVVLLDPGSEIEKKIWVREHPGSL
jgi:hypothetical protein